MYGVGKKVIEIWAIFVSELMDLIDLDGEFLLFFLFVVRVWRPYLDNFVTKCYTFSSYSGDSDPD